ncbi:hypothetical protein [Silvimonas iriomotensis]|uniref:Zorya protein ZorC EH domain-containing protein n=1 Tax=Silvimonas iriomotensis TaxID=449662 RepID=A0ABQ2PDN0_9NEIS|nr:hypothetical protein [Silvimonas iriomotensis]GGP23371.1 hypothetical protein GCM10010970_33710 [Silvimonas iriomotensis]
MFDFKGLVSALFINRAAEGVHDYKSATLMMAELPESDILQAQIEIVKALRQLNTNPDVSFKERSRAVPYLDEKARVLQRHLVNICEGSILDDKASPQQVLPTMLAFWREMGDAYRICIKQALQSNARGLEKTLHQFTLRAITYYGAHAKWCWLRYLDVETNAWRNLHKLYLYAEEGGYTDAPLAAWDGSPMTDVRGEYLQTLMLSLATPDKLQPRQIETVAHWLARWSGLVQIEKHIRPHHQLFAVNLAGSTPPKRLRRDMVGDNWRYWGTEALVRHMEEVRDELKRGANPLALSLPADAGTPGNVALLQQMINLWSQDVPQPIRKQERRVAEKKISVVRGLDHIAAFLRGQRPEDGLPLARWSVENESDGGMALVYRAVDDDKLQVGEVLCMAGFGNKPFTIGVVRRLNKTRDGQVHVGVEALTQTPVAVELTPLPGQRNITAIYAPDSLNPNHGRFIIVPEAYFAEEREFQLAAQGKAWRIKLTPAIELSSSAVLTRFNVLEKVAV